MILLFRKGVDNLYKWQTFRPRAFISSGGSRGVSKVSGTSQIVVPNIFISLKGCLAHAACNEVRRPPRKGHRCQPSRYYKSLAWEGWRFFTFRERTMEEDDRRECRGPDDHVYLTDKTVVFIIQIVNIIS